MILYILYLYDVPQYYLFFNKRIKIGQDKLLLVTLLSKMDLSDREVIMNIILVIMDHNFSTIKKGPLVLIIKPFFR